VKTVFTIGYYRIYIISFEPNLIIRLQFKVLPNTENSVIFLNIFVGIETPAHDLLGWLWKWA